MVDKLIIELQKLEEYTGVSVESLYKMLEKQADVQLLHDILAIAGCAGLLGLGVISSIYFIKKDDETNLGWHSITNIYEVMKEISLISTLGIITISIFVVPARISEIIQILLNKHVWILEYVTKLIK